MPVSKSLPYPRCCVECDNESVVRVAIPYNAEVKHDGKLHSFFIPELHIDKCTNCGEEYFSSETDGQISKELRVHLCFLQPEEIRAKRSWNQSVRFCKSDRSRQGVRFALDDWSSDSESSDGQPNAPLSRIGVCAKRPDCK